MKTRVVFRRIKKDGDVIALFPEEPASNRPNECMCYQHLGQHGAACLSWVQQKTGPCMEKDYLPLKRELERIGYDLDIVSRITRKMTDARLRAAYGMRG
jgi:hypothetical protein